MTDQQLETQGKEYIGARVDTTDKELLIRIAERRRTSISTVLRQLIVEEAERIGVTLPSFTISA